jgi:hypothetical protein
MDLFECTPAQKGMIAPIKKTGLATESYRECSFAIVIVAKYPNEQIQFHNQLFAASA